MPATFAVMNCNAVCFLLVIGCTEVHDCSNITYLLTLHKQMNHRTEFKEPKKLVQVLLKAWERMTKEEDVKSTLREVSSWNEIQDPSKCEECLQQLLKTKSNLAKSKKPQAWPILYLSRLPIQQYLAWVVKVMQGKNTKHIKPLMQKLLEPSDVDVVKNFPDKDFILKWLNQTNQHPDSEPPKIVQSATQHKIKPSKSAISVGESSPTNGSTMPSMDIYTCVGELHVLFHELFGM